MSYEIPSDFGCPLVEPHPRHVLPADRGWCAGYVAAGPATEVTEPVVRELTTPDGTGYRVFVRPRPGASNSGPW